MTWPLESSVGDALGSICKEERTPVSVDVSSYQKNCVYISGLGNRQFERIPGRLERRNETLHMDPYRDYDNHHFV